MKLDLPRWREALVRLEADLRVLKRQRRVSLEPGESFDPAPLLLAKAEVTRLYCLRRHLVGKLHTTGQLWCVRRTADGRAYPMAHPVTDLASQEKLLRTIDGWLEGFLLAPAAPTTG